MKPDQKRKIQIKLRAVAAEAESLADDLRDNKIWEGDCARRLAIITENLATARREAADDR